MKNLTRKSFIGVICALALSFALMGCSSGSGSSSAASSEAASSSAAASADALVFTTGGQSGTYYAFGQVLANHATNNADVEITAVSSEGSKDNLEKLEDGLAEFGFVQSDVMAYAYDGTNIFEDQGAMTDFSTVAALYDEQVQIVTCDPDIKSVEDLRGKRVSIGAANSGVYFNAIDILGAYDITEADIDPTYQSFGDSADALKNEQIDAAFIVAGAPTTAITDLSTSKQAYLVSLDQEHVATLIEENPYYVEAVIPAGTYAGIDTDTITVAVSAVIVVANDVPDDQVYAFVSDIFGSLDDETAAAAHAKYEELSLEKGGSVTSVPYHPGAAKYFDEQNIEVVTE